MLLYDRSKMVRAGIVAAQLAGSVPECTNKAVREQIARRRHVRLIFLPDPPLTQCGRAEQPSRTALQWCGYFAV